jgi:hypothetical protein
MTYVGKLGELVLPRTSCYIFVFISKLTQLTHTRSWCVSFSFNPVGITVL